MGKCCVVALAIALGTTPAAAQKVWRHAIIEAKSDAGFAMMVTRGFAEKQALFHHAQGGQRRTPTRLELQTGAHRGGKAIDNGLCQRAP